MISSNLFIRYNQYIQYYGKMQYKKYRNYTYPYIPRTLTSPEETT